MPEWTSWVVALLLAAAAALWWQYGHFRRRGVPYARPVPFFGFLLPVALKRRNFADAVVDVYKQTEGHSYAGVFNLLKPVLLVRDPDVIRLIGVKDFHHFTDRVAFVSEEADPILGKNLISLKGKRWHDMRGLLSPAFTSSKLKSMFLLINEIGRQMVDYLEVEVKNNAKRNRDGILSMEMKDFFTRFTNDVIATTAFGIKVDSLNDPKNKFYLMSQMVSNFGSKALTMLLCMNAPKLMKMLKVSLVEPEQRDFFDSLIKETIDTRVKKGIVRPDMINLLLQVRNGELKSENQNTNNKDKKLALNDDDIVAQAVLFLIGGYEPVSTFLAMAASLITNHPQVQKRLQEEIDKVMEESDGNPSYDQIHSMKYLDMVVSEILRMYTPGFMTDRLCVKEYRLPDTETTKGYVLKPGDVVWFPSHALHHDPKYFPDPEKFDPERFSEENRHKIQPMTYNPFGVGPRFCIGQRLALTESKTALVYLLSKFDLTITEKTQVPVILEPKRINMLVKGGSWVGVKLRT